MSTKQSVVNVLCAKGLIPVYAYTVTQDMAIHRAMDGDYNELYDQKLAITHIHTGRRLAFAPSLVVAKEVVKALTEAPIPWAEVKSTRLYRDQYRSMVREIVWQNGGTVGI